MSRSVEQTLENLTQACGRLGEAVAALQTAAADGDAELAGLVRDAAIQRFEFTFELAWKLLGKLQSRAGLPPAGPRPVLRRAYAAGWIDDEGEWLAMVDDRNLTTHVYDEALAVALAERLPGHLAALRTLLARAPALVVEADQG